MKKEIKIQDVINLLSYDPESGIFTRISSGKVAGTKTKHGYISIRVSGERYLAHRIAFAIMTGQVPFEVDHINHRRDDNRWINLRPVSAHENSKNKSFSRNNKSGHTGVRWHKRDKRYIAQIFHLGRQIHIGSFLNIDDAIKARNEAQNKLNFHCNHGSSL